MEAILDPFDALVIFVFTMGFCVIVRYWVIRLIKKKNKGKFNKKKYWWL